MTKNNYQRPVAEVATMVVMAQQHLMAGSVRNDDQKIFNGDPDPGNVDPGDQNTHPADSKQWDLTDWDGWDD
ncbi:MAG: hypothetical protein SOY06_02180 [Prevotella sp.]|nr:hypothetical protein [Bacteroidales bacterium]MDY4228646.1 hypothetical protein [Prevotella sp.]